MNAEMTFVNFAASQGLGQLIPGEISFGEELSKVQPIYSNLVITESWSTHTQKHY